MRMASDDYEMAMQLTELAGGDLAIVKQALREAGAGPVPTLGELVDFIQARAALSGPTTEEPNG